MKTLSNLFLICFIIVSSKNFAYSQWNFNHLGTEKGNNWGIKIASFSSKNIWIRADSIYLSRDSGQTFKVVTGSWFNYLPVVNDSTLFSKFYVPSLRRTVYHISNDYGKTWKIHYFIDKQDTAFNRTSPSFFYAYDDKNSVMVTDSSKGCQEIWKTGDGGNSWKRIPCEQIKFQYGYSIDGLISSLVGSTLFKINPENYTSLIVAKDYGNYWDSIHLDINNIYSVRDFAFSDSLHGLLNYWSSNIADPLSQTVRTEDGGKTWQLLDEKNLYRITYAKATSKHPGFYFAQYSDPITKVKGAKVSFNNGYDWKILDSLTYNNFQFKDAENGICAVFKDSFIQIGTFTGFPVGFANTTKSIKTLNVKIFPNPAIRILNIESAEEATYEIYRINGQLLSNGIVRAKQTHSILLDDISIISGMYYVVLRSENSAVYKKIIVE